MNRAARLQALAWSLPDLQPAPVPDPVFSGRKAAERGEVGSLWAECPVCRGDRHDQRGRACFECKGDGGWHVDPYTDERAGTATSEAPRRTMRKPCDRCHSTGLIPGRYVGEDGMVRCPPCEGTGSLDVPLDTEEPTGLVLTDPRNRMLAQGSYAELEAGLAWLHQRDPIGRRTYLAFARDDRRRTFLVDQAEEMLLRWMPDRIRVPAAVRVAWASREQRATDIARNRELRVFRLGKHTRDERIERMMRAGNHTSQVARKVGCSEDTVLRVWAKVNTLEAA